jgi:hypothetical protein
MPITVEKALETLRTPTSDYAAAAAHVRFAFNRWRTWDAATPAANAKKPDPKAVAKLVTLVGDVQAPYFRHFMAECHEAIDAGPNGLRHALDAAACSPAWDPVYVAWSIRGIAFWLRKLGRTDEARRVIGELWRANPFYPLGLKEAAELGVKRPALLQPSGPVDHLRLAGFHALLERVRSTHLRHIAMASSLLWSGDFAAAARMASLAGKGAKVEATWAADIAAFAAKEAKRSPGNATPLPDKAWAGRGAAVREAVAAKDVELLRALALDPNTSVMLEAWVGLAKLGESDLVRPLLEEMIAASKISGRKTELCFGLEDALLQMAALPGAKRVNHPRAIGYTYAVDAVGKAEQALAAAKNGSPCSLPLEQTKLRVARMSPSLKAWLHGGGGLHEKKASTIGALAKAAHGPAFRKLPANVAALPALPLDEPDSVNDTLEVLVLAMADQGGETPVVALDVSDGPKIFVTAESFGAWVAADVGLGAPMADAISAASRRMFGRSVPKL